MEQHETQAQNGRSEILKRVWGSLPGLLLLVTIVLIVGLFMVIGDRKDQLEEERAHTLATEKPAINVIVMKMRPGLIRDRINLPGIIEPWERLELLAKIDGAIVDVPVSEGDWVSEGDIMAGIDPTDYEIRLVSAKAAYTLALANFKRAQVLFDKGLIPQADLDSLSTQVQTTRAAMKNGELMLSRCTITAPISGIIRRLDAKVGLLLNVADPIARILQVDRVKAMIGIPESDVSSVQTIDEVELTIQALDDRVISGRKHQLAVSPDSSARLYKLELEVDNQDGSILPGMFVRAEIVKKRVEKVLAVPLYSVLSRNGDKFVFVEEDGVARRRDVKLGIVEEWLVEVVDGLQPGDHVIVEGHRSVEDGQEVKVARLLDGSEEPAL